MAKILSSILVGVAVGQTAQDAVTKEIAPGVRMPFAGFGTWEYNSSVAEKAVSEALSLGIRSIDTAFAYQNQDGVGRAIAASGIPRSELFVTTKVVGGLGVEGTVSQGEYCLGQLGLDYVDLLLVHFPSAFNGTGADKKHRQDTWRGLENLVKAGKARAIGVSHYCQQHLEDVLEMNTVPIAINQQEWHVGMGPDPVGVPSFCAAHNITYQSFSPLCGPCGTHDLINGELVTGIGAAHNVSGPQVSLKWLVNHGSPVIPKSSNPEHIAENMDLFSFDLTAEEMAKLDAATSPPSAEPVSADCKITMTV